MSWKMIQNRKWSSERVIMRKKRKNCEGAQMNSSSRRPLFESVTWMTPFKPERSVSQSSSETAGGVFPVMAPVRGGRWEGVQFWERAETTVFPPTQADTGQRLVKRHIPGASQQLHPPLPLLFCSATPPSSHSLLLTVTGIYHWADTHFHTCFLFTACCWGQLYENAGLSERVSGTWGPRACRGVRLQLYMQARFAFQDCREVHPTPFTIRSLFPTPFFLSCSLR